MKNLAARWIRSDPVVVAMPDRVDLRPASSLSDERIVAGHRAVVFQAKDLAVNAVGGLRLRCPARAPDRDVDQAVKPECQPRAGGLDRVGICPGVCLDRI